ncbi:NAD-dependent epimerase/dehydratase family protein [Baekduia soli]|uniref:NAD-dependent epimerase/dehydratase family protein n=1 Tax=Baekduia soli TaxID=496014 RepID=A0A5B8U7Y8_9ACTN|nr:NAD-dependent epimerase/dehydratase family protein [Baekduia soli]QEC49130.1 NAD-dependent epimerase/dehydratase family protein [Baekduia soli]
MTPADLNFPSNGAPTRGRSAISTYVVTGVAGFIGSHLAEMLLARGDAVIGIDAFTSYYPRKLKRANLEYLTDSSRFSFLEADLNDAPLESLFAGVDGVFHLAAQPGVRGSWGQGFEHYVRDNVQATSRVFDVAAAAGVRVVYASSSSIYGDAEGYPTTEATTPQPRSPYGVTKLTCEHLHRAFSLNKGLDAVGLRYFTVYGPRQRPDMATQRIAEALCGGGSFEVFGTGEQSRDVTYVEDAARATLTVMEVAPTDRVYNVGGGSETTLREIIATCEQITGETLEVTYTTVADGDVKRTAADTSLILEETGWSPQVSLEDGLTSQLARTMSHQAWEGTPAVA